MILGIQYTYKLPAERQSRVQDKKSEQANLVMFDGYVTVVHYDLLYYIYIIYITLFEEKRTIYRNLLSKRWERAGLQSRMSMP